MTIPRLARSEVYEAAKLFVDRALRADDSLFTPGRAIWAREPIDEITRRFVDDPRSGPFLERWEEQLGDASDETIQLAAEALYVRGLVVAGLGSTAKRAQMEKVLGWLSDPVAIPDGLAGALESGIAAIGAGQTHLPNQLRFLLRFADLWMKLDGDERQYALAEPWGFKDIVDRVPTNGGGLQREALLHLVFPEAFEPVVSRAAKQKIANAFPALGGDDADIDRRLNSIRTRLDDHLDPGFGFYDEPLPHDIWIKPDPRWDEYLTYATLLFDAEGFGEERDYKLRVAGRLRTARDAFASGSAEWLESLKHAFGADNNLTNYREHSPLLVHLQGSPENTLDGLRALWTPDVPREDAVRRFLAVLPREVASGPSARMGLASFLLLARGAEENPFVRLTLLESAFALLERPRSEDDGDLASRYEAAVRVLRRAPSPRVGQRDRTARPPRCPESHVVDRKRGSARGLAGSRAARVRALP